MTLPHNQTHALPVETSPSRAAERLDLVPNVNASTGLNNACTRDDCRPPAYAGCPEVQKESRLREMTLRLTPSVYSLNMGTGIVSILLYNFPYPATWLQRLGIVIYAFNVVLFVCISMLTIFRYVVWKGLFTAVNTHPLTGMFWGCLPMGFATIVVSSRLLFCVDVVPEHDSVRSCAYRPFMGSACIGTLVDRCHNVDLR